MEEYFGGIAYEKYNDPAPKATLDQCKASDAVLLACVGDVKYDTLPREFRPESGLLKLRSALNLFANIRPVKIRKSLLDSSSLKKEIIKNVDLIVVRELIGGIYFGQPRGQIANTKIKKAFNTMVYDSNEIERITEVAIKIANQRSKKICSVDKSNVLEVSQLWRDTVLEVVSKDKNLSLSNMYVDNAAMQLVKNPSQFDVILTSNLFGDILSDLAAMITGSIGMLPSASLSSSGPGVFEPVHGSAPDIAGKNIANPLAMVLSTSMMLKIGLNETEAAEDIEIAIDNVLSKGYRTSDLDYGNCQVLSCSEIGEKNYSRNLNKKLIN
jgi:3-isopropylmalate dehydrogenase